MPAIEVGGWFENCLLPNFDGSETVTLLFWRGRFLSFLPLSFLPFFASKGYSDYSYC